MGVAKLIQHPLGVAGQYTISLYLRIHEIYTSRIISLFYWMPSCYHLMVILMSSFKTMFNELVTFQWP